MAAALLLLVPCASLVIYIMLGLGYSWFGSGNLQVIATLLVPALPAAAIFVVLYIAAREYFRKCYFRSLNTLVYSDLLAQLITGELPDKFGRAGSLNDLRKSLTNPRISFERRLVVAGAHLEYLHALGRDAAQTDAGLRAKGVSRLACSSGTGLLVLVAFAASFCVPYVAYVAWLAIVPFVFMVGLTLETAANICALSDSLLNPEQVLRKSLAAIPLEEPEERKPVATRDSPDAEFVRRTIHRIYGVNGSA